MSTTTCFWMKRALTVLTLVAATAAWADTLKLITSQGSQGANDSVSWSQLGSDGTILPVSFIVQSAKGTSVAVPLMGPNSVISVVCANTPCSWTGGTGFVAADSLLWTSDASNGGNGPVILNFAKNVAGGGALIQADGPGQFTVQVQAFNGSTLLGSFNVLSDANGDATYVGVVDQTGANITSLAFGITTCVAGSVCSDFGIDTIAVNAPNGAQNTFTLTLAVNPTGAGSITANPLPQNGVYAAGTKVCLTTSANPGWAFSSWSGDPLDSSNCVIMSANRWETANFTPPPAVQFIAVTPCRIADTRNPNGEFGGPPIQGGTYRNFVIPDNLTCGIPSTAAAYSLNVTVVPSGPLGYLTIWPTGETQPVVSTMNSLDGRIKANAAIVPAGTSGSVSVFVTNTTNVVLDIDGYFAPASAQTLQFYPLKPCRIADTRKANGDLGGPFLSGQQERDFPVLESACIPQGVAPQAYSFNFTAVPHPSGQGLGYLTVWPEGESRPLVSTLNNLTGTIVANAAIVPAGTGGAIAVYPDANTDLVIDINGYFAAPASGGLSLYTETPCRVIDTRKIGNGQPFSGELTVNVVGSSCAPPSNAQAYVFSATVVPQGGLGYLTLWPDGQSQPVVSTLNAIDGAITSNMAIVPNINGKVDAYASGITQLILDISSYFAP